MGIINSLYKTKIFCNSKHEDYWEFLGDSKGYHTYEDDYCASSYREFTFSYYFRCSLCGREWEEWWAAGQIPNKSIEFAWSVKDGNNYE